MDESPKKWQRVTLTKAARATELGMELVKILGGLLKDGVLADDEITHLRAWLAQARAAQADLPALSALRDVVETALADGKVTDDERREIVGLMLRVLPAADREPAKEQTDAIAEAEEQAQKEEAAQAKAAQDAANAAARAAKDQQRREAREKEQKWREQNGGWRSDPATEAQLNYLRALGVEFDEATITKGEACELIDDALNGYQSVTRRQIMVLRFWDQLIIAEGGKRGVCDWMDDWYAIDDDHIAAWEMWKEANGDCGHQTDPNIVPIGAGFEWLKRVKSRS